MVQFGIEWSFKIRIGYFKRRENQPAAQASGSDPPDSTPPIAKIQQFSKISVTIETMMQF